MVTCNGIHISQEIFTIDVLALKSSLSKVESMFWACYGYVETRLVKNNFSGVRTSRYCLRSFTGSPISISILHKSNTVHGSGSSWPSNYQTTV